MNYSGVIYAVIVAAWAALLVPRWVRRNEDVEQAREVDQARRVRVLDLQGPRRRGRRRVAQPVVVRQHVPVPPHQDRAARLAFQAAARRRRHVLLVLLVATVAAVGAAVAGLLPLPLVVAPVLALAVFGALARRAALSEQRRLAADSDEYDDTGTDLADDVNDESATRLAVYEEEFAEPVDPDAWNPVPVPLPTYVTKAKAEPVRTRSIDLSADGAWTSSRLDPAREIVLPRYPHIRSGPPTPQQSPEPATADASGAEERELDLEQRRAVGD